MKVLAPNTLLQNRYLVVHLIGKGGMGEVYLAVDQRLGSAIALKRTFFADNETLGNAFEREARILGRLRHPVLPKVSDHFIENDNQYLVMEHISGDDLSKRLEMTQKAFPLSWVLFWADQLLDALSYLHSHEPPIIHRDIKPQNLKLTDENNIILLDFGLSKSSIGDSRLSNPVGSEVSGSITGYTPHYAPMEQIRGTGTGPRSDIYSLSATIYQLLTNLVPPDALSRADSLLNGSPDPVQPINELNAEVNKSVSDVIIKGMAVSQDLRYTNAREMQKELRDAYAQLQKSMSAQTMAFTAPVAIMPAISDKTEPLISVASMSETAQADAITEVDVPANIPAMETESLPAPAQNQQPNFDATLHYDGEPQMFPSKQADIKTEVFSGGIIPSELESAPVENYSPDATTPLINFDGQDATIIPAVNFTGNEEKPDEAMPATAMFMPSENYPAANFGQTENFSATETFSAAENFSSTQDFTPDATQHNQAQYNSQPQPAAAVAVTPVSAPAQKKSSGKVFAILGVLGLLLFLGIGAAGFGWWYMYGGGSTTTENDATPTPTPASAVSPTPTPQEILVDNNSNTNMNGNADNSNTELTNSDTNSDTNTEKVTPKPDITKPDITKATPIPVVTPKTQTTQIVRVTPTPKKTETSTAGTPKITPVKTPKKDDPTKVQ